MLVLVTFLGAASGDVVTHPAPDSAPNRSTHPRWLRVWSLQLLNGSAANRTLPLQSAWWNNRTEMARQRANVALTRAASRCSVRFRVAAAQARGQLERANVARTRAASRCSVRFRVAAARARGQLGLAVASVMQRARGILSAYRKRNREVSRILRRSGAGRWYEVLQVRRTASKKQLKDGYRQLAKRVHPDKTRDQRAEQAFNALRDAYDLLSDPEQRARYDQRLARQDEQTRHLRRRRVSYAIQTARRSLLIVGRWSGAVLRFVWLHQRFSAAVFVIVLLRMWAAG